MKKMKKYTAFAICATMIFSLLMLTGCDKGSASAKDVEFLTASEYWYHYDEVTGESEKMSFHDDFTFYWGCECGEPIGDSDCYELFDYDEETSIIKLYNEYDDMEMELEVLDYSDYHLLLKIDGEIKDYTYSDSDLEVVDSEKYMDGYSGEFALVDGDITEVVLGPYDYDGDEVYPENAIRSYPLAENFEASALSEFTKIKNGEVVENTVDYQEFDAEEAVANMEYGGYVFVWFNDNMEVSKILFYGATIAEE